MPNEFVVKNGLIAQNNSIVSGSLIVTNGITGSLFGTSSQAVSASFTATASYGFFVVSASYAFTASSATNSTNALTASSADNFVVRQSLTASNALVNGRLTAQTLVVSTISSSVVYSSGSNIFGNSLSNTQTFTGSVNITGSINLNNSKAIIGDDGTFGAGYQTIGFGGKNNGFNRVFGSVGTADGLYLASATGRGIFFRTNGSSITNLLVSSSGFVGLGTNLLTPQALLHISGSSSISLMQISSTASSSLFFVSGSGNIGIGTITPEFKLDISGSGQARIGAAEVGNWPSVTNYAFFGHERLDQTAAGNYALLQDSGGNTYVNAPTGKFVALRNSNTTIATVESARFTLTGSFGFSGSMLVTGSITGSLSGSVTGSLFGTASQAITASFARFAFSASFAPGFSVSMSQLTPATTWSFTHNLNSRNPIVQVYDTTFAQIIPNQIVGMNNSLAEIRFDYAQAGYAVASNGGGLYVTGSTSLLNQTSAAVTWSFTHNLNSKYVAFEIYDSNDNVIIPSNIRVLNENSAEIHLSTAITGRAVAQFSGISGTPNAFTASYALTASFVPNLNQNVFITGSLRTTGSVSITGSFSQTSGYMVLSQVSQSLNYADDTAAAAAGVPLGGIYRNGNFILIRLS